MLDEHESDFISYKSTSHIRKLPQISTLCNAADLVHRHLTTAQNSGPACKIARRGCVEFVR